LLLETPHFAMKKVLFAALASTLLLSSCSLYPLGNSHSGRAPYFGGHGNYSSSGLRPNLYVPRKIQRNNAMTIHP
jgi:hypothetical protein